jgi:hypothetical protein
MPAVSKLLAVKDGLISRYVNGELALSMAPDYGVSCTGLLNFLKTKM